MKSIKISLLAATVLVPTSIIAVSSPAEAQTPTRTYSIASEDMATALHEFATQSGQEVVFDPDMVRGKVSQAIEGALPAARALQTLLDNSGLTFTTTRSGFAVTAGEQGNGGAHAQAAVDQSRTPPGAADRKHNKQESAADTPLPKDQSEIVVTAQRRLERLQDVPVAVTVLTPKVLEERRINSSEELAQSLPSVVNISGYSGGMFAIRGQAPSFGAAPGAYVYFAEVPELIAPTNTEPSGIDGRVGTFFDLANIEVLKGPQGTLFGRNATGGNILFVPRRPDNRFDGYVQGQVGNYSDRAAEGAINIPVVDGILAVRVAGAAENRRGYVTDVGRLYPGKDYENINYYAARVSVLFTPSDSFEDYLIGRVYDSRTNGPAYVPALIDSSDPTLNMLFPDRQAQFDEQQARGRFKVAYDNYDYDNVDYKQVINKASFHVTDAITLANIISYSDTAESLGVDFDASTNPILNQTNAFRPTPHAKMFTGELQLTGKLLNGDLDVALGAYLDSASLNNRIYDFAFYPFVPGNGIFGEPPLGVKGISGYPLFLELSGTTKSHALYSQETLDLGHFAAALHGLKLTAGYRYTWEQSHAFQKIIFSLGGGGSPGYYKNHYGSYNLTANYELTRDLNVYVSVRDAYKSGGVNAQLSASDPNRFYAPEKLVSKEIGLKSVSHLSAATLTLDLAAFSGSYENIQRSIVDPTRAVGGFTTNVAQARIRGIEADAAVRFGSRVTISENYAYTDSAYTKITDPSAVSILTGATFPYTPKNKSVTSVTVDLLRGNRLGDVSVSSDYSYQSKYSLSSTNAVGLLGRYVPGFGVWNASIDWRQPGDGPWSARIYAANLTNVKYWSGTADFRSMGFANIRYGPPRTYALQVRYRF